MKKVIFFIPLLFIAVSLIVSCTGKCTCGYYINDSQVFDKLLEVEKHMKNCKDQSGVYEVYYYTDSLGNQKPIVDNSPQFICK